MKFVVRCAAVSIIGLFATGVPAQPQPAVTSERIKAALVEFEKLVGDTMKKTGVPGLAVAVVHRDALAYIKGFGVRQVGKEQPVDADTVFQIASLSKPVGTTVLAALVGERVIDWDDRIIDHDAEFRMYDPWVTRALTFRDLLCHRSGLPAHAGDLVEDLGYARTEILYRLRFLKPASSFRSQYAYTNFGFTEAGVAGARAAKQPWEELCAAKLFRPLGMSSTSSRYADFEAATNRAALHAHSDGQWTARYVRQPDAQSPAGGVCSTVRDLSRWMRLQLAAGQFDGRPIIAAGALAETHRPQIVSRPPENPARDRAGFYGLGWNVSYDDQGRVRLGHSGGFELGAATVVNLIPSEHLGIVVLTNASPIGVPEALAASFLDLVLTGKTERDWVKLFGGLFEAAADKPTDYSTPPAKKSPPLPADVYVAAYRNDYFGDIEIVEADGTLLLRSGPKKTPFPLRHWNRDTFLYKPVGEMAAGLSAVTFQIGPDGRATVVVVENLNVHGRGTFTRVPAKK